MKKTEIRYPDDPKAQKQWEIICRGVDAFYKNRAKFIRDYQKGKIEKTIFNEAKYRCYTR